MIIPKKYSNSTTNPDFFCNMGRPNIGVLKKETMITNAVAVSIFLLTTPLRQASQKIVTNIENLRDEVSPLGDPFS